MNGYVIPSLGLYCDTIRYKVKECYDIIEGAKTITSKYDYDNSYSCMRTDIDTEAKEMMRDYFDFENMTNSIISAYHQSTIYALNACPLFKKLHIRFNNYVNCDDSHISMCMLDTGLSIQISDENDIPDNVYRILHERLHDAILRDLNIDYPVDYIEEDMLQDEITDEDIELFLNQNVLSECVKARAEEFEKEMNE